MKRNKTVYIAVIGLLVTFGAYLFGTSSKDSSSNIAPDFSLQDINGKTLTLSDYKGKVIILDFWATWCPPCRQEIPEFIELQERYKDDLIVIGVSLDRDGPKAVVPFYKENGLNYSVVYADGAVVKAYGGVQSIPTTFVIDKDFHIQRKYVGYTQQSKFIADIKALK